MFAVDEGCECEAMVVAVVADTVGGEGKEVDG